MNSKKKREIGLMTREAFDVDVTRGAQEKLHPHGYNFAQFGINGLKAPMIFYETNTSGLGTRGVRLKSEL